MINLSAPKLPNPARRRRMLLLLALSGVGMPALTSEVHAQSRGSSRPAQHVRLLQNAEQLLAQSRWEEARFEALSSLELDSSPKNEAAVRVLVEVYLATDQRDAVATELARLAGLAPTTSDLTAWLDRAQLRLRVERLEADGDAEGARALLTPLQTTLSGPAERAWFARLNRRVSLRAFEQERRFAEGQAALALASEAPDLEFEEQRWLRGAGLRLNLSKLWWDSAWSQAEEFAASMDAQGDLRASDRAWARRVGQRAQLWSLAQLSDQSAARTALAALGPEEQNGWTQGLLLWMDYAAALGLPPRKQDPVRLDQLWQAVGPWQASQPPGVRLASPASPPTAGTSNWVLVGAVVGTGATRHDGAGDGGTQATLRGALCQAEACWQAQGGLQAAGLWASGRGPGAWELGMWGHVRLYEPRLFGVSPWPSPLIQGHASLALTRGSLTLGLGPRLATGVYAREYKDASFAPPAELHRVQTLADVLADFSARVELPPAGLDISASVAAWPTWAAYGGVELGWSSPGLPLRVGLHGAALAATRVSDNDGRPALVRREWQAGINVSWQQEWR